MKTGRAAPSTADRRAVRERPPTRPANRSREPGLDLICTKLAVDFQGIYGRQRPPSASRPGCKSLTEACGADCRVRRTASTKHAADFDKVLRRPFHFPACNPEVLQGRAARRDFPGSRRASSICGSLEIKDTAKPSAAQQDDGAARQPERRRRCWSSASASAAGSPACSAVWTPRRTPSGQCESASGAEARRRQLRRGLERIELQEDLARRAGARSARDQHGQRRLVGLRRSRQLDVLSRRAGARCSAIPTTSDVPEWRLLVHPDDLAHVQTQLREHLEGRAELFESVHRMQHASGEWRWIQSRVKGRLDENRRLKRLVGVETDITERKLYEEALFREKRVPRSRCSRSATASSRRTPRRACSI